MERCFQNKKRYFLLLFVVFLSFSSSFGEIKVETTDVTCKGNSDGKATISVVGATGNFRYSIDGASFQASGTFTGLKEGSYTATVKDEDTKCQFTKGFSIKDGSKLSVSVSGGGTFTFCQQDGPPTVTLTASASGGTPPYTYNWPGGQMTTSSSGTYTATVTDKNGCTADQSVQVIMIPIVCSRDPNDIVGPAGVGPQKWISRNDILPYTIRFENDPDFATAPAQVVRISQVIDPHANIYSIRLGSFGFGSFNFEVPENRNYYSTRLDVKDSLGVLVDVVAGIDVNKNEIFWVFKSIDPATGLAPSDASLGFLLLNDSLHRGEGFVSYTIKPKTSSVTGDSLLAEANIVFDINEAIRTPEIFNTIDALPPNSTVDSIPAITGTSVSVTVTAEDENGKGSGVASYDLYASENGGTFSMVATNIPVDSSCHFKGKQGAQYCIYSQARDKVGNIESGKTAGERCFTMPRSAYVAVLNPADGQEYCGGTILPIRWESEAVEKVSLFYSSDDSSFTEIATEIAAADSIYSWAIPGQLAAGNYKLLIRDASDSTIADQMNSGFIIHQIVPPAITSSRETEFCSGDSVRLSVNPIYAHYYWSTSDTVASIAVDSSGWYVIRVTDENGCTGTDSISILVKPAPSRPVITLSGPVVFCQGDSVILSAPTGYSSYRWSNGDTIPHITASASGSFSVAVTDSNGCQSLPSLPVNVVVNNLPLQPSVSADGPVVFCQGDSVVLSSTDGFRSYHWSNGDTTRSIIADASGSFTVWVTDSNGCKSVASLPVDVTENDLPERPVIIAGSSTTFCEGDSVLLSAPGSYSRYRWSNGDTTQTVHIYISGSFTVSVTDSNSCQSPASDAVAVTVTPALPKPSVTASGSTTFCTGDSVVLSAAPGYSSYLWSNGATIQSITVNTSGSYTVSVMSGSCVSPASDAVAVTVTPALPKPSVTASGSTTFCTGDSVVLSAASGYSSYLWSNGATTQSITVNTSGSYTVSVMSGSCVSPASDAVAVTVTPALPKPSVTANGSTTFCTGDSVVLSAAPGYSSYLWSNGATTQSITVNTSGSYTVSVKSGSCTSPASDAVAVTVAPALPKPSVTASGSTTFCTGDSVVLSAAPGYSSYLWSNGATTQSITVNTSGSYTVSVMSGSCVSPASDAVAVTVTPALPKPSVTASGSTTFCTGDSVVLSAAPGYSSYLWSNGATTQSITVNTSGSYTVSVMSGSCVSPASDAVAVKVTHTPPKPVITASGPRTFCTGDSVVLSATSGYSSYLWSTGATTESITVNTSGSYTVAVQSGGCTGPASNAVSVTVTPLPHKPSIKASGPTTFCEGGSVVLTATAGYKHYLWSTGDTTRSITVNTSGSYTVMVISRNCNSPASEAVVINVIPVPPAPLVTASGSTTFCTGDSVVLSATSDYSSYLWSNGATTQSITVNTSGSYTVSVKSGNCVSPASDAVAVKVTHTPPKPVITAGGPRTFCAGDSVVLSATSGYSSYLWSTGATTESITVNTSGSYTVAVQSGGCTGPASNAVSITVTPLPHKPSIKASGPTTFCEGGSVVLTATAGYKHYLWSTGDTTRSITVNTSGSYSVMVISRNCNSPASEAVVINVIPVPLKPVITVDGPTTFCAGENVVLSAPQGYAAYKWSDGAAERSITVSSAGSYAVAVVNGNGCESPLSDQAIVNTFPLLKVDAGINQTVYNGYTKLACAALKASVTDASSVYSLVWSNGEGGSSISVCPKSTTVYTVTAKDANGCVASDKVQVCVIDVFCGKEGDHKVKVCHTAGGTPAELCLSQNAVEAHLSHHDYLGPCGSNVPCILNDNSSIARNGNDSLGEITVSEGVLVEAFPNPFFGSTYIRFSVKEDDFATLKVYDMAGKEVTRLFEGEVTNSESYGAEFTPADHLGSGIFFYKLTTRSGKITVGKLLLSR